AGPTHQANMHRVPKLARLMQAPCQRRLKRLRKIGPTGTLLAKTRCVAPRLIHMRKDLPSNTSNQPNTAPCPTCNALGYEKWSHPEPCAACGGDGHVLGTTCL